MAQQLDLLIQFLEADEELIDVREALLLCAHHTEDLDLTSNEVGGMLGNQLFAIGLITCIFLKSEVSYFRLYND